MSIKNITLTLILVLLCASPAYAKTAPAAQTVTPSISCEDRIEKALREYDRYEQEDAVALPEKEWRRMQEDMKDMHNQMQDMHTQMQDMHQMMRHMQDMPMEKK